MKVLVVPDKFKGSLSAAKVCEVISKGIHRLNDSIQVEALPVADGGEGSLSILTKNLNLQTRSVVVKDPLGRDIQADYGFDHQTAYIEMATASGLQLLHENDKDIMLTSTFGTGQLIADALHQGVTSVVLFIGGSATNDAGTGMAEALGYTFFNQQNQLFSPKTGNLNEIADYSFHKPDSQLNSASFLVTTDVTNILTGENGATYVYGPQKGLKEQDLEKVEMGMIHIARLVEKKTGKSIQHLPGAGAAGGLGFGAMAFLNARLKKGISYIIDLLDLESKIKNSDLVISGEGKLDGQTMSGKVVSGIGEIARKYNVPYYVICGQADEMISRKELENNGIHGVYPLVNEYTSVEKAMNSTATVIGERVEELGRKLGLHKK